MREQKTDQSMISNLRSKCRTCRDNGAGDDQYIIVRLDELERLLELASHAAA